MRQTVSVMTAKRLKIGFKTMTLVVGLLIAAAPGTLGQEESSAKSINPNEKRDADTATKPVTSSKEKPLSLHENESAEEANNLSLTLLRDSGLSLNQIRQQAINIFLEATRKPCNPSSKFELLIPGGISDRDIDNRAGKNVYLPPRSQWLIYYVGTVEPIISLFAQDVHDTKAGVTKLLVPEDTKKQMHAAWHEWTQGIEGINKELTEINDLIGDGKVENTRLAKHAVAMFKYTQSLERSRRKAFIAIRNSQKRHGDSSNKINIQ